MKGPTNPSTADWVLAEVLFQSVSSEVLVVEIWANAHTNTSSKINGKTPFLETSSWSGRQAARTKAMPGAIPIRRANATRIMPPSNGQRPRSSSDTKKPETSSELHCKVKFNNLVRYKGNATPITQPKILRGEVALLNTNKDISSG
ncbi:ZIP metal ion transporter family [Actinidia rufa]|uniref:ZIP metal ion transporter family n=1 Tax=Actinidia rufa TaxID=165716 RepID=A0A7J0E7R2_9ERIC|nr:ZIP metal ion transporter family [Actinidia rufa]